MKGKNINKFVCIILVLVLVMCSCNNSKANDTVDDAVKSADGAKKDSLVFRIGGEPQSLDPIKVSDLIAQQVNHQVYDCLTRYVSGKEAEPSLAERWDISEDGKEVTFYIKQGVKFHNGDTLTADDVVFSLNRAIESPFAQTVTSAMDKAEKVDDYTVKLLLKDAYGPVFDCLANGLVSIVNKRSVEEMGEEKYGRNPVGTGAYKFVEWVNGDRIILERFDDYYRGTPNIKNLTFKIMVDASTAAIALENGEIDILSDPAITDRNNLMNNESISYYETPAARATFVTMNNDKGLFSNVKLREAMSYAVDKNAMLIGAADGVGTILESAIPPSVFGFQEGFKNNPYDSQKAKSLMAEAGYPDGFSVTIKLMESPAYYKPAEVLQAQLMAIGIDASMEVLERGAFLDSVTTQGDYELAVLTMIASYPDADFLYTVYHGDYKDTGGTNFARVSIPKLDQQLEIGRTSMDRDKRAAAYSEVCEIMKEYAPIIPLFADMQAIAADKELKGLIPSAVNKYFVFDMSW